jgi:hypothetical protein
MAETKKQSSFGALPKLTQADAAALIGRRASFMRERTDLFVRDDDGKYDARQVVAVALSQSSIDLAPAELSDVELEGCLQVLNNAAFGCEGKRLAGIRLFKSIERRAGAAGLLAIMAVFMKELEAVERAYPSNPPKRTADEIRAEADRRIAELNEPNYYGSLRILEGCYSCHRHRFAGKWQAGPLPSGYVSSLAGGKPSVFDICPKCESQKQ